MSKLSSANQSLLFKGSIRYFLLLAGVILWMPLVGQTILQPGDLAPLSINTNNRLCNNSGSDNDVISFVCFKDILPGTKIDITDNGWERALANRWGNSEGFITMTRSGPVIKAGTVITLQFPPIGENTYRAIAPDSNWTFTQGTLNPIHLNSAGEQLYFLQGGTWNNPDSIFLFQHRATYDNGRILFAINTKSSWTGFINNSQESGLHPLASCLNINPSAGATDFLGYSGDFSPATLATWTQRMRNPSNWRTYNSCALMPPLPQALQILPDSISFHCKSCRGCGPFSDTLSFKLPATGGPYQVTLTSGRDTLRIPNLAPVSRTAVFIDSTRTYFLSSILDGQGCPLNFNPIPPLTITVEKPTLPVASLDLSACATPNGNATFQLTRTDSVFTLNKPGHSVSWFLDSTLRQPVPDPSGFSTPGTIVFASLYDGFCTVPQPAKVRLNVLPLPEALVTSTAKLCGVSNCLQIPLEINGKGPFALNYTLNAPNQSSQTARQNFTNSPGLWSICLTQPAFQKGLINLQYQSLTDANGCTTDLSGKSTDIAARIPVVNEIRQTLCFGESVIVNGKLYDEKNPRDSVLLPGAAAGGCDSLIVVDLSFHPPVSAGLTGDSTACPEQEFLLQWQLSGGNFFKIAIREGETIRELNQVKNGDPLRILTPQSTILAIVSAQSLDTRCEIRPFSAYELKVNDLKVGAMATPKFGSTALSCHNAADGEAVANITGGFPPYRIQWSNGASTQTITALRAGNYGITVTDAKGCQFFTQVAVSQPTPISTSLEANAGRCALEPGRLVIKQLSGGVGPYIYALPGQEFKVIERLPVTLRNLTPGSSMLTIQDANGCSASFPFSIPLPQVLTAELGPDQVIASGDSIFLKPEFNFSPEKISWNPPVSASASRPLHFILRPGITTTYQLIATDSSGCTATDAVTVFVEQRNRVFVPGAFSPNGDNINDRLVFFTGPEITLIRSLRIFNRWGTQIFEVNNAAPGSPEAAWDGLFRGEQAPPGVYIYQATLEARDGKTTTLEGDIVLMR